MYIYGYKSHPKLQTVQCTPYTLYFTVHITSTKHLFVKMRRWRAGSVGSRPTPTWTGGTQRGRTWMLFLRLVFELLASWSFGWYIYWWIDALMYWWIDGLMDWWIDGLSEWVSEWLMIKVVGVKKSNTSSPAPAQPNTKPITIRFDQGLWFICVL